MYHNTFSKGKQKEIRLKEMHHYVLDISGEYSSTSAKYFTIFTLYSNQSYWKGTDESIRNQLDRAITIANSLNRSLVIPPITCNNTYSHYCNICYFGVYDCFKDIFSKARFEYKESVNNAIVL